MTLMEIILCLIVVIIGIILSVYFFNSSFFIRKERMTIAFAIIVATGMFLLILIFHQEFIRCIAVLIITGLTCYMTVYANKHLKEDGRHPNINDIKLSEAISVIELNNSHHIKLSSDEKKWVENYIDQFTSGRQEHSYLVVSSILKRASQQKLATWTKDFRFKPFKEWLEQSKGGEE